MLRVAIVGFGLMGRMHFQKCRTFPEVEVTAVCDTNARLFEKESGVTGNIAAVQGIDLTGVGCYTDFDRMLAEAGLDAVLITLPTFLHAEYSIRALRAGLHVLCEKPMALSIAECRRMIAAAKKSGRVLQIGHCIRFWPEYAYAKAVIESGEFGRVRAARFHRLGSLPGWGWDGWFTDPGRSGGVALDLHIHDSDFVQYAFGMPPAVFSRATAHLGSDLNHIVTQYLYDDGPVVTAEGSWLMTPSFGFEMSFMIVLEKATLVFDNTRQPTFRLCPASREIVMPSVPAGDGYLLEIAHFIKDVQGQAVAPVTTLEESCNSVRLVLAEMASARTGRKVALR
jgi:1,5-anhydro-D-fructose reductase (1,5-anhydro-D-mannitol-forming)